MPEKLFVTNTVLRYAAGLFLVAGITGSSVWGQAPGAPPTEPIPASVTYAPSNPRLPTIFVVGDSTATKWGPPFVGFFNLSKVNVVLAGAAGRSSRTYITEGLWARVQSHLKAHDVVLIELGRNDSSRINDDNRARGTLPGNGEETQEIDNMMTHQHEVVHTSGWYLRQIVEQARIAGATPILMSETPKNVWKDGQMVPVDAKFEADVKDLALQEHCMFVDITSQMIARYDVLGEKKTTDLYGEKDPVHVNAEGSLLNAAWTLQALGALPNLPLSPFLSDKGQRGLHIRHHRAAHLLEVQNLGGL